MPSASEEFLGQYHLVLWSCLTEMGCAESVVETQCQGFSKHLIFLSASGTRSRMAFDRQDQSSVDSQKL